VVDSKPVLVDYSQLLLEVSSGKSDVTFYNNLIANRYLKQNPGKLKRVGSSPIRIFAECFTFPRGDYAFSSMMNSALLELIENGALDRAFLRAGENPSEYYRRAYPFRLPNN
jgi:ABC-type amino acid transport substrate-binding protein